MVMFDIWIIFLMHFWVWGFECGWSASDNTFNRDWKTQQIRK